MRTIKHRAFKLKELRSVENDGQRQIVGHAAVFNQLSENLGGFRERIFQGAFKKTIQEADVRGLMNHDKNLILGRTKSGTLRLREDDVGLWFEIDTPNTSYANDLHVSIDRGDIDQASFSFSIIRGEIDENEKSGDLRIYNLREAQLYDVSPVTFPAYPQTDVSANSLNNMEIRLRHGLPLLDEDKQIMERLSNLFKEHLSSADENHAEGRSDEESEDIELRIWEDQEDWKEVRYSIRDDDLFKRIRSWWLKENSIRALGGPLKTSDEVKIQSLRFIKKAGWTLEKAKAWVKDHPEIKRDLISQLFDNLPEGDIEPEVIEPDTMERQISPEDLDRRIRLAERFLI